MTCNPVDFVRGATLDEAKIIDPMINGGELRKPVIDNPALTGGDLTLDEAALNALYALLEPLINHLTPDEIAGVFRDCHNNLPLTAETRLPTCADLDLVIDETRETLRGELAVATQPSAIAGVLHNSEDLPLSPGSILLTKTEIELLLAAATQPAAVAGVFKNKDGLPLSPGSTLLTQSEIEELVKLVLCEGCGGGQNADGGYGDRITSLTYNSSNRTLAINVVYADDSTQPWTVILPDFMPRPTMTGNAPALTGNVSSMPVSSYGIRTAWLGTPTAWMNMPGTDYVFPVYEKATV